MKASGAKDDVFLALEPEIETALTAGGVGVWRWKIGSAELGWTRNLERIHLLPEGAFDGAFQSFAGDIDEGDLERVMETIQRSIETGEPYQIRYRNRPLTGDEPIWIEARGEIVTEADGSRYMTGVCQNATARINAQHQLERRLRQQQAVSELGTFALAEEKLARVLDRAVEVAGSVLTAPLVKILELSPNADTLLLKAGTGWAPGLVGRALTSAEQQSLAGYTLTSGKPVIVDDLDCEERFSASPLLRDHEVRSSLSAPIVGDEGRPYGVFSVHTRELRGFDASDADFLVAVSNIVAASSRLQRISERRRIVIREMAHRSGNMFQLVQSLFNQTVATADPDQLAEIFRSRLGALSSANFLIADDGWTHTRIRRLLETALGAFEDRLTMTGRDILLPADLAFDLALVLHELATNSTKYGALARAGAKIDISWLIENGGGDQLDLRLTWDDPTPPQAVGAKRGTGFGSRLIASLVERKWGGAFSVNEENGYRFVCTLPLPAEPAAAAEQDQAVSTSA